MHTNRETVCYNAVKEVFLQIPEADDRPHGAKVTAAAEAVLPCLEHIFQMPSTGPQVGSEEWVTLMREDITLVSFKQLTEYPELLRIFVKHVLKMYCVDGKLKLLPGEYVPTLDYDKKLVPRASLLKGTRRQMQKHKSFTCLRSGGVQYAFEGLRNLGFYPLKMHPKTLPKGLNVWSNYAKIRVIFYVYYCYSQGYTKSSDLARLVLVYVFHGKALMRSDLTDIMIVMHKRLQNGMHRLTGVASINLAWNEFFTMLKRNPKLETFLDDRGRGKPGKAYCECVERCLRQFAFQKQVPFGVYAMESYQQWTATEYWKKREAYIAAVRAYMGLGSYNKYIAYDWKDYVFRLRVGKTFLKRHYQYSNGAIRLQIAGPPAWALPPPRRRSKFVRKRKHAASNSDGNDTERECEAEVDPSQEWDSEEGEFVSV